MAPVQEAAGKRHPFNGKLASEVKSVNGTSTLDEIFADD